MKNISILFILVLLPIIVYASWWNPFSWKIFSNDNGTNKTSTILSVDKILICNGEKWNQCPEGQRFVCPLNDSNAYCELISDKVKTPINRCAEFEQKSIDIITNYKFWTQLVNEEKDLIEQEYKLAQQTSDLTNRLYDSLNQQTRNNNVYNEPQATESMSSRIQALQSQRANERATNKGLYEIDPNSAFSPDQVRSQRASADSFYDNEMAKIASEKDVLPSKIDILNKKMGKVLDNQKNINSDLKIEIKKLQAQYPKCLSTY